MSLCLYKNIIPAIARLCNKPRISGGIMNLKSRVVSTSTTLPVRQGLPTINPNRIRFARTTKVPFSHGPKASSIGKSMECHCVVPDVIPCPPPSRAEVCYKCGVSVDEGNCLTPTQVKDEPTITWKYQPDCLYTICMVDPDVPCRKAPKHREWQHWLVGNIPGCEVCKGKALSAYIGAAPLKGTGLHRYVFLVYKQPCKINFTEKRLCNNSAEGRSNFKIQGFAMKYKLGSPIAGNFFLAEYDCYVPYLLEQLNVA